MVELQSMLMHAPVACVIFLITIATSILSFNDKVLENKFILHPWSLVREKKWYTLITSGLIHGNIPHLLMNMLAFYYYGFILERLFVYEQGIYRRDAEDAELNKHEGRGSVTA